MAATSNDSLPDTIEIGNGAKMTFLRNEPYLTRTYIPASDQEPPSVPLHWHEMHDEIFHVLTGRIEVRIGNETRIYVPGDGEVRVPKGVLHGLRFFAREECIFEVKTDPMDEEKEMFFRNLMEEEGRLARNLFQLTLIAYHGDMCPALPWHFPWLEKITLIWFI